MKRILIPLLVAALVCLGLSAMAEGDTLAFDAGVNLVFEGETLQTVLTREGAPAEGEVIYASSDSKIATVNEGGLVTGLKKGKVTITASVRTEKKTFKAQLKLTVARPVTSIKVTPGKLTVYQPDDEKIAGILSQREDPEENKLPVILLPVKKGVQLTAVLEPKDATDRKALAATSDPGVFSVKQTTITGVAEGEAILTVSSVLNPDVKEMFRVRVIQPVTKLTASASAPSVAVGQQITLSAAAVPENATLPAVLWASGDERIATVDPVTGVVTGVKKGTVRMTATVQDGSNIRASISVKVTQNPEQITFKNAEVTVDAGKSVQLTATVLPANTDNKKVTWSSADESIATVSANGRVSGISLGTCEITCTSAELPEVKATAVVHVQQPVTSITLDGPINVYMGETTQATWTVLPENASNPVLKLTSSNVKIFDVSETGLITPVKVGSATLNAASTDGSRRRAKVKVNVLQHVTGVHMYRRTAYIDKGATSSAGAVLEPKNASNHNMTWVSADPDIARVSGTTNKVKITGVKKGSTVITGTTEDGGFQASLPVKVGDWEKSLKLTDAHVSGADIHLTVKNVSSELHITSITAEVSVTDINGDPVPANRKNNSNKFTVVYKHSLNPGQSTKDSGWSSPDFKLPESTLVSQYEVRVVEFQIDNDWVKMIRKQNQPNKKCPVHI